MEGDHETRIAKLEERSQHHAELLRAGASLVQDQAQLRERVDNFKEETRDDLNRLGDKVRTQDEKQDRKRDDLARELTERLERSEAAAAARFEKLDIKIEEGRNERKSDGRYSVATALTVATVVIALIGLVFIVLQFSGVGHG